MIKTMKLGMFVCALLGGFAATGCVADGEDPGALAEAVEAATIESGIPDTTALEAVGPDYHGCPAGKFCLWEHANF
ncbi:hypothetical protein [Sorangium sp. So ce131]|uniref:hypothetical protein n=1 Tax=Sorangium sp. So ce131 TaxID=3133282 RepID=UPI003F6102C4